MASQGCACISGEYPASLNKHDESLQLCSIASCKGKHLEKTIGQLQKSEMHSLPELKVHEAVVGVGKLLKAIIGQVKVVDVATARRVVSCDGGAVIVILQTGTVVSDMNVD